MTREGMCCKCGMLPLIGLQGRVLADRSLFRKRQFAGGDRDLCALVSPVFARPARPGRTHSGAGDRPLTIPLQGHLNYKRTTWLMDETCVRVTGAPGCTCSEPLTIAARTADLYFSETRDHSAAKLLLSRSLANSGQPSPCASQPMATAVTAGSHSDVAPLNGADYNWSFPAV